MKLAKPQIIPVQSIDIETDTLTNTKVLKEVNINFKPGLEVQLFAAKGTFMATGLRFTKTEFMSTEVDNIGEMVVGVSVDVKGIPVKSTVVGTQFTILTDEEGEVIEDEEQIAKSGRFVTAMSFKLEKTISRGNSNVRGNRLVINLIGGYNVPRSVVSTTSDGVPLLDENGKETTRNREDLSRTASIKKAIQEQIGTMENLYKNPPVSATPEQLQAYADFHDIFESIALNADTQNILENQKKGLAGQFSNIVAQATSTIKTAENINEDAKAVKPKKG